MESTLTIDGVSPPSAPDAGSVQVSVTDVANSSTSEAGTTIREVVRSGIHVVTASFSLTGPDMSVLAGMVLKDSLTLTLWIPDQGSVTDITCWLSSGFKPKLKSGVGGTDSTTSCWTVDLEFTEF